MRKRVIASPAKGARQSIREDIAEASLRRLLAPGVTFNAAGSRSQLGNGWTIPSAGASTTGQVQTNVSIRSG